METVLVSIAGSVVMLLVGVIAFFMSKVYDRAVKGYDLTLQLEERIDNMHQKFVEIEESVAKTIALHSEFTLLRAEFHAFKYKSTGGNGRYRPPQLDDE